jgi:hypothetical protein
MPSRPGPAQNVKFSDTKRGRKLMYLVVGRSRRKSPAGDCAFVPSPVPDSVYGGELFGLRGRDQMRPAVPCG